MLETIAAAYSGFIGSISNYLYTYILIVLLVAGGIYFTVRTKFVQFRFLPESIRIVMQPSEDQNSISAFKTLMVSTASRVGTGNIAGISTAICLGGTGAVFWMWVTALLGSATAFVEGTLAQIYKKRAKDGSCYGGPAYYIEQALKQRWLGVLFAVVMILTYMVGFNLVASFNIADSLKAYSFYDPTLTPWIVGIVLAVVFLVCISGGGKQIANITAVLVPVMGVLYLAVTLFVVFTHISLIPAVFASIFRNAFNFQAIFGGFVGSALMQGIKRGLFSNEAGIGAAACAAGSAGVSHPAKQGLVQMLSVFIDTLLICTATALMCLCSGVIPTEEAAGAPYVQAALQSSLGNFGPIFIAVSMALFAFTTLIGNYYYCEGCLRFIFKRTPSHAFMTGFRLIAAVIVLLAAFYPRFGFIVRRVEGDVEEHREQIVNAFRSAGFELRREEDDALFFRAKGPLHRLLLLGEDEIKVSQYGQWIELEGIRRGVARVIYRLDSHIRMARYDKE